MVKQFPVIGKNGVVGQARMEKQGAQYLVQCRLYAGEGEVVAQCLGKVISLGRCRFDGELWRTLKRINKCDLDIDDLNFRLVEKECDQREITISDLRYAIYSVKEKRVILDLRKL